MTDAVLSVADEIRVLKLLRELTALKPDDLLYLEWGRTPGKGYTSERANIHVGLSVRELQFHVKTPGAGASWGIPDDVVIRRPSFKSSRGWAELLRSGPAGPLVEKIEVTMSRRMRMASLFHQLYTEAQNQYLEGCQSNSPRTGFTL